MTARDTVSPAAAGCMLLVWGQPTDRALAGWAPWSDVSTWWLDNSDTEELLVRWLRDQLVMTEMEQRDRE